MKFPVVFVFAVFALALHIVPAGAHPVDAYPTGYNLYVEGCGDVHYAKGCVESRDLIYVIQDYLGLDNVGDVSQMGANWVDLNNRFCEHLVDFWGNPCRVSSDNIPGARLYIAGKSNMYIDTSFTGPEIRYNGIMCKAKYYFSKISTDDGECLLCPPDASPGGYAYEHISYIKENTYCFSEIVSPYAPSCIEMCRVYSQRVYDSSAHGYVKGWCQYNPSQGGAGMYNLYCQSDELVECDKDYYRENITDKFCTHCPSGPGGEVGYTDTMGTLKTNCRVNCGAGRDENGSWDNGGISLWQP